MDIFHSHTECSSALINPMWKHDNEATIKVKASRQENCCYIEQSVVNNQ